MRPVRSLRAAPPDTTHPRRFCPLDRPLERSLCALLSPVLPTRLCAFADVVEGYREDNPAQTIAAVLPKGQPRKHLRAVPHHNVAQAIAKVRASGAYVSTRLSLEFTILTAARSGEVRLATWTEVDMDAAVWIAPASKMKAKREHRVP